MHRFASASAPELPFDDPVLFDITSALFKLSPGLEEVREPNPRTQRDIQEPGRSCFRSALKRVQPP